MSDPKFNMSAVSNVTARDIQIGQIVQKIVYWGLPFNSRHLHFVQLVANSAYFACLIYGFIRLWQEGADFATLLLLIGGSGLLSLTCLYYAGFWKPELQDKNAPGSEPTDLDKRVKAQRSKHRSRQGTRRLAIVGIFAIPLLTFAGFWVWRSMPAPRVLLLVANFDGVEQQNYQVTENILRNLRSATNSYADVKVQALHQTITEQQGSEVAQTAGERKKASIVIWGEYGVTADYVQLSTHFEVLKPPAYFPDLGQTASGAAQTAAIAELNSFKLQTRLSNEMSYLTLFTLGMVQYAKADWDGAIVRFKSALEQGKEPVAALSKHIVFFQLANSYLYKSDYRNAIANYNQALKLKPDLTDAYNNRGIAYDNQGNYSEAIADYNQALKLNPDFASAYNNRGIAYTNQGKYTEAIVDFSQALKLQPDYAVTYNNRGATYANQGKYTEAIVDFSQALKLQPDGAMAYSNRGAAYTNQGKYIEAIADFGQALKLQPDYAVAYYNRGLAYYNQGKYIEAIADFNQALKLQPDYAKAYHNRGSAYATQGKYIEAIADFNQALKLQPDFTLAYYNRGLAYAGQGEYIEAIADFNQALKLQPDNAKAYYTRGIAYATQGKYTEAIDDYNQALKLNPDLALAYNNRGLAYSKQGKYSEAIADFNQALKLNPDYALAYYNKACVYSSKREIKEAIENLQRAIDLNAKLRDMAKTDSDFDNIRQDRQFRALVGQ